MFVCGVWVLVFCVCNVRVCVCVCVCVCLPMLFVCCVRRLGVSVFVNVYVDFMRRNCNLEVYLIICVGA